MAKLLAGLNQAQTEAVTHTGSPLLIVAGAGTGKTTVLTRRIAYLIEQGKAKPEELLAVTFTEKAAHEMEERVDQLLPYGYVDLWISTFHGFCQRVLEQHALDIGLPNEFKIITQTESWRLVRHNLARFELDYYRPLGNPTKFLHALLQHFSRCKDEAISPEQYLDHAEHARLASGTDEVISQEARRTKEVARAYHTYQQLLFEHGFLDFGDLLVQTLRLFQERPKILQVYRARFKEVLVDEFQDTNWAQFELIKLLRPKEIATSPEAPRNDNQGLTVVGDDDQSIFAFRGASMSNILHFKEAYSQAREIILTENYRSQQSILDLSYAFIKQNDPERLETRLKINKQLKAQRDGAGIIAHLPFRTEAEEAHGVRDRILALARDQQVSWNDIAILVRANAHAEVFLRILDEADIPYQFLASFGLLRTSAVLDIISYFRLLDNYHESRALYRILRHEFLGIANEDLERLLYATRSKPQSLYEVSKHHQLVAGLAPATREKLDTILQWIDRHTTQARKAPITKICLDFLNETGYLQWITGPLQNRVGGQEERKSREQASHIRQFYKRLEQFVKTEPEPTVRHFLQEADMMLASGDTGALENEIEAGPEAVKIFTIHGAKGLEFRYVFLVNMVEQRFPSMSRHDTIEIPDQLVKDIVSAGDIHLQEERRLCYVAITRARDGIFFTSAEDYGGTRKKKPSRFLYELGLVTKEHKPEPTGRTELIPSAPAVPSPAETKDPVAQIYSFSQLRAYEMCPLQYKFAHIVRIPTPGKAQFVYGRTIHSTMQKFLEEMMRAQANTQPDLFSQPTNSSRQLPPLERLLKIYDESWQDDWFETAQQRDEYKAQGERGLRWVWAQMNQSPPLTKFVEKDFTLKIGAYTLKGRIDRIDETDQGLEIIDYKTGRAKTELTSDDKQQLLIYQLAAQDPHLFASKVEKLTYHYIDDQTSVSFLGSEKELDKIKHWIVELIQQIESGSFKPSPGQHCKFCDFKDICEFAEL